MTKVNRYFIFKFLNIYMKFPAKFVDKQIPNLLIYIVDLKSWIFSIADRGGPKKPKFLIVTYIRDNTQKLNKQLKKTL